MQQQPSYPFSYKAFNLNILSQFPISVLEKSDSPAADVLISEGKAPDSLSNVVNKGVVFQAAEKEFLFRLPSLAAFYVHSGKRITIERFGHTSFEDISVFLLGTAFGALLHQRFTLPLHASSVVHNGKCLVFAGISGAGKSTLAASMIQCGSMLLADDITAFTLSNHKLMALPAFPAMKMWEDSLNALQLNQNQLQPVRNSLKKYYLETSLFHPKPVAAGHIFILFTHNRNSIETTELKGIDKYRMIKKYTYLFRAIPHTVMEKSHFTLASQLANSSPITLIGRPLGSFNTSGLMQAVLKSI